MASDSRALWDDSDWLSWPVVGDRRGRRVLGALAGAPLCSSQCGGKKKMKQQRRLLFAPYLVPLTPSLWTFLLKVVERRSRTTTTRTWKKFPKKKVLGEKILAGEDNKRLFCMVFDAFFFLEDCGTPARVQLLQWQCVCLCAWGLWVPATGCLCWLYRADGACIVELRVNDTESGGAVRGTGGKGECLWSHWGWMQGFCLCRLSLCWLFERGFPAGESEGESAPSLPGGGTTASYLKHGRLCLF